MLQKLMELTVEEGTGKNAALSWPRWQAKQPPVKLELKNTVIKKERFQHLVCRLSPASNPAGQWVLVEDGTSGAADAAPVFKAIARAY